MFSLLEIYMETLKILIQCFHNGLVTLGKMILCGVTKCTLCGKH